MLKGLMTYNAPLEMSANKGNGTRLKERLVGVPVEKVWNLPKSVQGCLTAPVDYLLEDEPERVILQKNVLCFKAGK